MKAEHPSRSWTPRRALSCVLVLLVVLGSPAVMAPTPAAADPVGGIRGIDIANYQHPGGAAIDWGQVAAAGYRYVLIKATEGPSAVGGYYTNPYFSGDRIGAAGAGLYRGAYHFARPALPLDSAIAQARYFVSVTGTMRGPTDLPPVLDLESTGGLGQADLTAWTQVWLNEVESLTGRRPIIYTGYYFWNGSVNSAAFGGYRLWMARYTSALDPLPLPMSWSTWSFWQYSSSGQVPGISGNVDVNVYCCTDANLAALADGATGGAGAGNPFGRLDGGARVPGGISVSGWAIDPDTTAALTVHVYVDGALAGAPTASAPRGDIGAAYPGWGSNHGIDATVATGPGDHQICVYAMNVATGTANILLGCLTVVGNPVGALDTVASWAPGTIDLSGWAIDPDVVAPIEVHVYVDGRGAAILTASAPRLDLAAIYPAYGSNHGFSAALSGFASGAHSVCAYAINLGSGALNTLLRCAAVNVLTADPIGSLDLVMGGAGVVRVGGWALDPDSGAPISVEVVVDGAPLTTIAADASRGDIGAAFPPLGPNHGFDVVVGPVAPGSRNVCVNGVNTGPGLNRQLGCRVVNVISGSPFGAVDAIWARLDRVTVTGWTIDPDTAAPIDVHVYVDGVYRAASTAGGSRPDVGAAYPIFGAAHGFDVTIEGLGGGSHTVCVYALGVGSGANAQLGCRSFVLSGDPFGSLDQVVRSGATASVVGWAIDPDTTAPITVHVYRNGVGAAILTGDVLRADVGASFPAYGSAHGFSTIISGLSPGAGVNQVCAYAINTLTGNINTQLGCLAV